MCGPGDNPRDLETEARILAERDGVPDRRVPEPETNGAWISRWVKDTLRMWPFLLLLGAFAIRFESVRDKVIGIEKDFVSVGPRVTTMRPNSITIEAAFKEFQLELAHIYQPREIAELDKRYFALQLTQIAKDQAEIKEMLKGWMRQEANR